MFIEISKLFRFTNDSSQFAISQQRSLLKQMSKCRWLVRSAYILPLICNVRDKYLYTYKWMFTCMYVIGSNLVQICSCNTEGFRHLCLLIILKCMCNNIIEMGSEHFIKQLNLVSKVLDWETIYLITHPRKTVSQRFGILQSKYDYICDKLMREPLSTKYCKVLVQQAVLSAAPA